MPAAPTVLATSNSTKALAAGTGLTVTFPSGSTAGDLVVMLIWRDTEATSPGVPLGWTSIAATTSTDGTRNCGYRAIYRIFDGTEGPALVVNILGTSGLAVAECWRITGYNPVRPVDDLAAATATRTDTSPGATTRGAARLVIDAFSVVQSVTTQTPSGTTLAHAWSISSATLVGLACHSGQDLAGASTARDMSTSSGTLNAGVATTLAVAAPVSARADVGGRTAAALSKLGSFSGPVGATPTATGAKIATTAAAARAGAHSSGAGTRTATPAVTTPAGALPAAAGAKQTAVAATANTAVALTAPGAKHAERAALTPGGLTLTATGAKLAGGAATARAGARVSAVQIVRRRRSTLIDVDHDGNRIYGVGDPDTDDAAVNRGYLVGYAQPVDPDLTALAGITRTEGDLIAAGATSWERLAAGVDGQHLTPAGGRPSWAWPTYTTQTGDYTLDPTDRVIDFTAGAVASLPPAGGVAGIVYDISNSAGPGATVTVTPDGAETIHLPGGAYTAVALTDGETLTVQSTGTSWRAL